MRSKTRTILSACIAATLAFILSIGILASPPTTTSNDASQSITETSATDINASTNAPSEASSIASSKDNGSDSGSRYSELPENAFVADEVLITVSGNEDAATLAEKLRGFEYVVNASPNATDVAAGFMKVTLKSGTHAGSAADALCAQGITAQPNFVYYLFDEREDSGAQENGDDAAPEKSSTDADKEGSSTASAANTQMIDESNNKTDASSTASSSMADTQESNVAQGVQDSSALIPQTTSINDPRASEQWALSSIHAYDAWDLAKVNKSIAVAVIDTGCKIDHPDLVNNIVGAFDTDGLSSVEDDDGHGTHVASIIAAEANNGEGIAGISYNAGLYIVRALHNGEGSTDDLLRAYQNIIDNRNNHNIRVINMSLGMAYEGITLDDAFMNKVDQAANTYGILTVAAAGNSLQGVSVPYHCYPADFSHNVLNVINLRNNGASEPSRYSSSNYNIGNERSKGISAPGTSILGASLNGGYTSRSGTSMASPYIAGVAALVLTANPNLTPAQAQSIIYSSAIDLGDEGFDRSTGYGEIDALKAVQLAQSQGYISGSSVVLTGSTITLSAPDVQNWMSDKAGVATVNQSGDVTGISAGYTTIYAVTSAGERLAKTVVVYDSKMSGPSEVTAGETASYSLTSRPVGNWSFSSSNESVATISTTGTLTGIHAGATTITATLLSDPDMKITKTVVVTVPATDKIPMYRLYNPNSGEHFYTGDINERNDLERIGWIYEGTGWTAPRTSSMPVYRLYNANGGEHHYTTSASERDMLARAGWKYEGIGWYSDDTQQKPLFRLYNPNAYANNHHYTTSSGERDWLVGLGWIYEGLAWYGV